MSAYVFIDRVLECEPGERVIALKALAFNEEFFRDHFPGMPVLPGAMVLEGFVQAARHCLAAREGGHDRWTLDEVGGMRFNRFAAPGEVLQLEANLDRDDEGVIWFKGKASVDGTGVCRLRFAVKEYGPSE
ncbi:MAG: 3-hydroxyacyl-ACP dehydratase FabZ family protein [Planctomycetota bacterium]|jgi:3-hydroxyacyl-[acyl-carrier-protein] dehydratase